MFNEKVIMSPSREGKKEENEVIFPSPKAKNKNGYENGNEIDTEKDGDNKKQEEEDNNEVKKQKNELIEKD